MIPLRFGFALAVLLIAFPACAAERVSVGDITFRAQVEAVVLSGTHALEGVGMSSDYQELSMRLIEGPREGEVVEVTNDSSIPLAEGDVAYVRVLSANEGAESWAVIEPDRRGVLFFLAALFALVTVVIGGMAGVRALISLVGSFALIAFALLPLLAAGTPPVLTSVALATVMLAFSMVVTHGMKRHTLVAFIGSFIALAFAAALAEASVEMAKMTGFVSDEAVNLNFQFGGALNLAGLLLGGILIGIVGVLNDISVSQVHTVAEIHAANPTLSRRAVLVKAIRVGREHLGAVVNTLPLAYAGASLPLLLLFATTEAPFLFVINREVFSSEAIRILAGGIALSISGAIATVLAVYMLVRKQER